MKETPETILKRFYSRLHDSLERDNRLIGNSVVISLLDITKTNARYDILTNASITKVDIPRETLSDLVNKGLISQSDQPNRYVLTAKGLLQVEHDPLQGDELSSYLSKKIFGVFSTQSLNPKERIILLSMIAVRSFSEESLVDMKNEGSVEVWRQILDQSYAQLRSLNIVPKTELYGNYGNESPVSSLFRHINDLTKKTKGLYKSIGKQQYFLDLSEGLEISKDNLDYLFKQIWGTKQLGPAELEQIYEFCCKIAAEKHIDVFESGNPFTKPEYDDIVRNALFSWEGV